MERSIAEAQLVKISAEPCEIVESEDVVLYMNVLAGTSVFENSGTSLTVWQECHAISRSSRYYHLGSVLGYILWYKWSHA